MFVSCRGGRSGEFAQCVGGVRCGLLGLRGGVVDHRKRVLVGAAFLVLAAVGRAETVTLSSFPPNPGVMPGGGWEFTRNSTFADPTPPRAWVNGVYGAVPKPGLKLTVPVNVAGKAGAMAVSVARSAPWAAVGAGVARCLGMANPLCAAGSAAYALYNAYRVLPDGAGGLLWDPGTDPVGEAGWVADFHGDSGVGPSSGQALDAAIGGYNARPERSTSINNGSCMRKVTYARGSKYDPFSTTIYHAYEITRLTEYTGTPANGSSCGTPSSQPGSEIAGASSSEEATVSCPASIDPTNPAHSIPAGSPIGPDGKCPTARYNREAINHVIAGELWQEWPPENVPQAIQAADDALRGGIGIEGEPAGITGPASQVGSPSSTTQSNPDGSTVTTTKTPTYTYNYGGPTSSQITYNTSITTTINNGGDITTIVENGTPPEQQESECVKTPNAIGCLDAGTPPEGPDITASGVEVSWTPATGWGAGDAACPANVALPNSWGVPLEFNYGPVCQFLTALRPIVLALGGLAAAFIFMGYSREPDA